METETLFWRPLPRPLSNAVTLTTLPLLSDCVLIHTVHLYMRVRTAAADYGSRLS